MTIMVGRLRKIGVKREKNGRAQRTYINPRAQVASQPHRLEVHSSHREREEAGTRFGRMMLNGVVTPAQYQAGVEYARLSADHRRAIFAPAPEPAAMRFEAGSRGHAGGMPDDTAQTAVRRFTAAFNAIGMIGWQCAVMRHAVHDGQITDDRERALLRCGLDRLVLHFGLDRNLQIRCQ